MQNLNLEPLKQPVTKQDIQEHLSALTPEEASHRKLLKFTGVIAYIGAPFISIAAVWMILIIGFNVRILPFDPIILISSIPLTVLIWFAIHKQVSGDSERQARIAKFSRVNNIQYQMNIAPPYMDGVIFDVRRNDGSIVEKLFGTSRSVGTLSDRFVLANGVELANYVYTTGSGKSQRTHHWSYIRLPLKRRLPHILIDSIKNNIPFINISTLPTELIASQKLKLEGDFNTHFTVYSPKEYEADVLYILTPDVMAALIDANNKFAIDLEVIDDHLYIYQRKSMKFESAQTWEDISPIISALQTEINDQSDYYMDDRVGNREANIVDESGIRLKRRQITIGGVISLVFVILYIYLKSSY